MRQPLAWQIGRQSPCFFLTSHIASPGVRPLFQAIIGVRGTDLAKTGPAVGQLLPKHDLMGGQGLAEIVVNRRAVDGHRQHVGDRSAASADNLDAHLRADYRRRGLADREVKDYSAIPGPFGHFFRRLHPDAIIGKDSDSRLEPRRKQQKSG